MRKSQNIVAKRTNSDELKCKGSHCGPSAVRFVCQVHLTCQPLEKKKIDGEKKFGSDIQPHSSPLPTERPSPNPLDPSWTSLTCCVSLSRHQTGAPARRSEARRLMFSQREHEWGREMRRPRPPASTSASFKHRHDPPSRPTLLSLPPPSNCVQKSADWLRRLLLLGKEEWINRWIEK